MIFVANVLVMNGGTTFLLRMCKELHRRNTPCLVLVLFDKTDSKLLHELQSVSEVIFLKDYLSVHNKFFTSNLRIFAPIKWNALRSKVIQYGPRVHVMGGFGLIFAQRMSAALRNFAISAGVYHQNEFVFRPLPFSFTRHFQRAFKDLSPDNIVFFNAVSRDNYQTFFEKDLSVSPIVPIGIETGKTIPQLPQKTDHPRLVSIGNLVPFKTYNRHMISVLKSLSQEFPNLTYDIYGDGPDRENLKELAAQLGISERVTIHGIVPYSEFSTIVAGADLFVGSGTALIEAADLSVPALIGIESIPTPDSYGFLCDINGLSYNERNAALPKYPMADFVRSILLDSDHQEKVGRLCQEKAKEFSIETTVDGFLRLPVRPETGSEAPSFLHLVKLYLSLMSLALFEKITGNKIFSNRRSESF